MSEIMLIESMKQLKNSIDTLCQLLERRSKKPSPEPAPARPEAAATKFDKSKLKGNVTAPQLKWIKGLIKTESSLERDVLEKFEVAYLEDIPKSKFDDALAYVKQKKGMS